MSKLLRDFVAFDAFLRSPVEDNYRYIGFTDTLVNIGEGFLAEDGIFKVLSLSYGLAQVFCFYRLSCGFPGASDRNLSVQCPRPSC